MQVCLQSYFLATTLAREALGTTFGLFYISGKLGVKATYLQCLSIRTDFLAIYDMIQRYFELAKNALKLPGNVFSLFTLSDIVQIFQKRYCRSFQTKGPQNYKLSKFAPSGNRTRVARRPAIHYIIAKIVASNPKGLEIFWTANFDGPYLCSRLSQGFE